MLSIYFLNGTVAVILVKELNSIISFLVEYFLSQSISVFPKPPVGTDQFEPTLSQLLFTIFFYHLLFFKQ